MKTILNSKKQIQLDEAYLKMAIIFSNMSYCKRKKVGCLIVKNKHIISDGYNGTPSGFENNCECKKTGETKDIVLHAEANALMKLTKTSYNAEDATMYVTLSPCINCAKLILQSGIIRLVYNKQHSCTKGIDLLKKAGVFIIHKEL